MAAGFASARLLVALLALAVSPVAMATGTDPTLALGRATVVAGDTTRVLRLDGEFPHDDLVQLAYPVQVLVHQAGGARYLRYDLPGGAVAGSSAALSDGLDPAEAVALLGEGDPSPEARVLFMGAGRLELLLPEWFPEGRAMVVMFVVEDGDLILSNPLPIDVERIP